MGTLEDSGGQNYYPINAEFRKYPSYAESLQDYANLLANGTSWNPNYYAGAWKSNAASYQDATAYLTGRYATDTAYSAKLNRIIAQYGLDQYDNYQLVDDEEVENPAAGNVDFEKPTDTPDLPNVDLPENSEEDTGEQEKPSEPEEDSEEVDTPDAPVQAGEAFHVVQPGDTLYAIAKKYGISLVDLLTLNKLTSNMIYVGDRLVLPDSVIVEGNNPDEDTDEEKAPTTPTSEYTVVVGDTLYKIAAANGLTVGELKSLNALTSDTIFVGQKLLLVKTTTTAPDKTENESNNNADQTTTQSYTVKSGDTLWSIANATNMTVAALKAANSLTSDAIYPGQVLKTVGTSAPTTGTNTGTTVTGAFIKPASGYISSPFGYRTSPINGAQEFHRGVDIAGNGTISAAQAGVVEVATYHYSYGNYVVINHGKINGVTIKTLYAHMQSGLSVSVGQTVSQGQKIGVMGTTGSSTGVHLHFEVQENGAVVNPMNYINGITTGTPGATTPTTPSNGNSVVVVSGDTLWKIANANGLTVAELKKLNNLTSDAIMTGQVLILKSAGTDTPNKPSTPSVTQPSNPAVPTPPSTASTITVASGDTLWKIANANGLSVAELKTLNNLSSDYIYPGQSLKVTKSVTNGNNSTGVTPPTVTKPSVPTVVNKMYTVQKGDTLYKIASANGVSVAELKAWNNLNTDIIFVNQSLKLAVTTSSTQTTAPTTSEPEASGNTYTVQKGDTLYSIAKKKGVSLAALIEANDMTSNVIYVGQVITF